MMERRGPDSLEGWFIAVICCLISTLMYGASGLSSMLFVASITRYDADRDSASFPYILSTCLQAVSGAFAGYFAKRFNSRIVVLVGSIFGFLGIGTCFFAEDITTVTILWGIVYGIGFGLSSLLLPVIINEYFYKQRSIALGMCYLGSPIGFFVFPPIFDVLYNTYGLSGTFLIVSGINLHCIPLSMLLKEPNFKAKNEKCPLKHEKKHELYSSTEDTAAHMQQTQQSKVDNNSESNVNGEKYSLARRHSVEFLWKQDSARQSVDKKYVLSLSKKCPCEQFKDKEIMRSFRKNSRNCYVYENEYERSQGDLQYTANESAPFNGVSSELNENNKYSNCAKINYDSNCYEYHQRPLQVSEAPPFYEHRDSISNKPKYEEVSAIYFGFDQKSSSLKNCSVHEKHLSSHSDALERKEETLKNSSHLKYDSVFHPALKEPNLPTLINYKNANDFLNLENCDIYAQQFSNRKAYTGKNTDSGNSVLNMYLNPVFILMCIINAIVNLHFTAVTTVIVDFSRDHEIDFEYEKFILMGISLSGAFGMLGFGWVTDGNYLTRTKFGAFTQLISSISTAVLPFTVGFETLMATLAVWCVCQSSFIPLIPAITADFFEEDMQAVAVSACNVLSGPLYLIIPPLIGYFRDYQGSYDNIFFLLAILSFLDCIIIFAIPYLASWRSKNRVK